MKLLQAKKDRDWVFLYLISFFEVLLAAGLSFSPIFLGTLTLYLLCGLSTIIAFEIQKARRAIAVSETHLLVPPDSRIFKKAGRRGARRNAEANRLPLVALGLLLLIFVLALPLFLVAPRSGAAALTRGRRVLTNFIGFSENVTLGEIGDLKRDNAVVMRVRIEDAQPRRGLQMARRRFGRIHGSRLEKVSRQPDTQTQLERRQGLFSGWHDGGAASPDDPNNFSRTNRIAGALCGACVRLRSRAIFLSCASMAKVQFKRASMSLSE